MVILLPQITFSQNRPNVIWFDLADTTPIIAAYGDHTISTPNIERLAKTSKTVKLANH